VSYSRLLNYIKPSIILVLIVVGCSNPKYIRGTKVLDTAENKKLIKVMEKYRHAMINRDVATLISMAHKEYFQEKNSPDHPPYDYKQLRKLLKSRFKQIIAVRMDIQYRKIVWLENGNVEVEFYIDASFLQNVSKEKKWEKKTDYMKMVFKKQDGEFLILSGL
jgi:hypothetical protein